MFDYFKKNLGNSTCKHCGRTLLSGEQCSCSMSVRERNGDTTCNHNGTYFHEQYSWKNDPVNKQGSKTSSYNTNSNNYSSKTNYSAGSSSYNSKTSSYSSSQSTYNYNKSNTSANKTTYTSAQGANKGTIPGVPNTQQVYNMGRSNAEAAKRSGCAIKAIFGIIFFNVVITFIVFAVNIFGKFDDNDSEYEYYYNSETDELYDKYTHETDYDYDLGSVSQDTYKNSWVNVAIPIPEGFSEIDEEEYEYYSYEDEDCAFMAENDSAAYIALYTSDADWLDSYTTAELLEMIAESYAENFKEMDIDYDQTTNYDAEIADATYLCTDFEFEDSGYFVIAVHRIETGYACLIVYDYAEVDCLTVLESINPVN